MNIIIWVRPQDNRLCFVVPAPKEILEAKRGPLTEEEYRQAVIERSQHMWGDLPTREIAPENFIQDRTFRNAWEDSQPGEQIDINVEKARDIMLAKNELMAIQKDKELDDKIRIAEMHGDMAEKTRLETQKANMRSDYNTKRATLRNMNVSGRYNDAAMLDEIRNNRISG